MNLRAFVGHILICGAVGALVAYLTPVHWLAAAFWTSAALFFNGSLAYYEDALPGGFDNPIGDAAPTWARGRGAVVFWLQSLAVTALLAAAGSLAQSYL